MLKATHKLIHQTDIELPASIRQPLLDTICKYGSFKDSEALYSLFLQTKQADLLWPVMYLGNKSMAEDLFHRAINDGKLKEDFPPQTLLALSYLDQQQTLPVLIQYYEQVETLDWDMHEAVSTALLNFDCTEFKAIIKKQVAHCLSKPVFNDFMVLPAACINEPELAIQLADHAANEASPSCCGPILLVMALSNLRELFKQNLLNPSWAVSPFVYNHNFISMGMNVLSISLKELYADCCIAMEQDRPNAMHLLLLISDLLAYKLKEPYFYPIRSLQKNKESFTELYELLFVNTNTKQDDSLPTRIERYVHLKKTEDHFSPAIERIEELYRMKMAQETEELYREKAEE